MTREQKLVDICFEVALRIHAHPEIFTPKTTEEVATWVAQQLNQCGFPTTPVGASWGVLKS